jgi:carboxylesterase
MTKREDTIIDRGPFTLGEAGNAALLIHGIAACPAQLRSLAEHLAGRGITCRAMLLPGHGRHYKELYHVSWRDWYAEAEREFLALRAGRERINIVGFSIGAAVAVELAANHQVDRLVLINTPLFYFYQFLPQRLLLSILNLLAKEIRTFAIGGSGGSLIYPRIPVKVLYTMGDLVHRARARAREIQCPTLIVHSTHDLASRAKSAGYLMRHLASQAKKIFWVRDRDHSVLQGEERHKVFAEIESFLKSDDLRAWRPRIQWRSER